NAQAASPEDGPSAGGAGHAHRGEHHHGEPEILRMQLARVRAPVGLARAYEALEEEFRYVVPRDCVRRRAFETRLALCTRGEGDVLEKRHDLDGRDPEPDEHGDERKAEPHD